MKPKYEPSEVEPRIYSMWENSGAFKAGANAKDGQNPFCIMIPPPNVTGALHMGHAFNNTLQDILIRWHRMKGCDVLWQPGQDHAGIATQMVVERQLTEAGLPSRNQLGRDRFLEKVWDWKEQSGGEIINQLKRIGASCDWSRNRFTMDKGFHDAVLKAFIAFYKQGLIYKGKRLVNWDPHFETAISDLEVEQVEVNGNMWYFRYPLADGESFDYPVAFDADGVPVTFEKRDYLVVATTRPETMLGDTGVAVHPEDSRYTHLIGKDVVLPLVGRKIRIVADSHADPTKGSGAVKITPAHDFNDWEVGKRTKLPAINIMTSKACMYLKGNTDFLGNLDIPESTLELDGLDRFEARKRIVVQMTEKGLLDDVKTESHTVPHGDRSNITIEPFLTDQWFLDTKRIVDPAIDAVRNGQTRIHPKQYEKIYFNWLENIEPWCISRQLWWGHQIPIWYDDEGNQYCALTEDEAQQMANGKSLTRDPDVLDTWFSSGIWPIGTLGWPEATPELERYFPTNVLVTGFDIIFFWVARMMMMQLSLVDNIPFTDIYVHALVRDKFGKKMSKSLGNVIDPIELVEKYGADSVRFTLTSMAVMGRDLKLSEGRVSGYRNFCTKIWNAGRFLHLNDCKIDPQFDPRNTKHGINSWIIGETAKVQKDFDKALNKYRFNDASNTLYSFIWGTMCDWYLEFSKILLHTEDPEMVAETKSTLAWVFQQSIILLHPIMPFETEELWSQLYTNEKRLLIHADWPELYYPSSNSGNSENVFSKELEWVISIIKGIRSTRGLLDIPPNEITPIRPILSHSYEGTYGKYRTIIEKMARAPLAGEEIGSGYIERSFNGGTYLLFCSGEIDWNLKIQQLHESVEALEDVISNLKGRLGNEGFVAKAPPEVVEETKENLHNLETKVRTITDAVKRIHI